jgi:hypothetical protein
VDAIASHHFEEFVIVGVVDVHANDHGAGRIKGLFHHGADLIGRFARAALTTDAFPTRLEYPPRFAPSGPSGIERKKVEEIGERKRVLFAPQAGSSFTCSPRALPFDEESAQWGVNSFSASREFRIDDAATSTTVPAIKDI